LWVRKLANDLRERGIDVPLDQWELGLGEDVPLFMETGVTEADRVLCICTENYAQKVNSRKGGAGFEGGLIAGELCDNSKQSKFIPAVRGSGATPISKLLPRVFQNRMALDFREPEHGEGMNERELKYQDALNHLVRDIHGLPPADRVPLASIPYQLESSAFGTSGCDGPKSVESSETTRGPSFTKTPRRQELHVLLVHGWGVWDTEAYGDLPRRLDKEANERGLNLKLGQIRLAEYVSFRDNVAAEDLTCALEVAVQDEFGARGGKPERFSVIAHSSGALLIRDWWHRYHLGRDTCPMSHLVMLAPMNFGTALSPLVNSRIGRLRAWLLGVEPGTHVLKQLALGSPDTWTLNRQWIEVGENWETEGVFPFVLTGQTIDWQFFDHLNSYTGEVGSDGTVRVAAANLNSKYVRIEQDSLVQRDPTHADECVAPMLFVKDVQHSPRSAMLVVADKSHVGASTGIMQSIDVDRRLQDAETVEAILACLQVETREEYEDAIRSFDRRTSEVQEEEKVEIIRSRLTGNRHFVRDRCSMVIVRIHDDAGIPVEEYDLSFVGGDEDNPELPAGALIDRQRNIDCPNTVTWYFNYDIMTGCSRLDVDGRTIRKAHRGVPALGLKIDPRRKSGFVHYLRCVLPATKENLGLLLVPNQTTLIDVILRRVVRRGVLRLTAPGKTRNFKEVPPGPPLIPDRAVASDDSADA